MDNFKKSLIINVGGTAIAALVLIGLIIWLSFDISKRTQAIQETKRESALKFKAVEVLASLKKDQREAGVQKVFLDTVLPIQDKLINFPKDLDSLAKQNNIDLGFSFGKEIKGTTTMPGYISFTMTTSAPFNNWMTFIEDIEKSRYLVSLDSFNLVAKENKFQAVINGRVFSQ